MAVPKDAELRELLSKFVCVRMIQMWGIDLRRFQFDQAMTWAVFFMNADGTIYGRYGTRSAMRQQSSRDISLPGFKRSIAAALTHRWMTAYCASKAGLNMLTMCAADDLGEHGIRVNAVMPGIVPTPIWGGGADGGPIVDEYLALMPISRVGTVEDVGKLVAFLLSDDAGWITGQCIGVDGGHTIRKGPDMAKFMSAGMPVER